MPLVRCTTALRQGGREIHVGDVLATTHESVIYDSTKFSSAVTDSSGGSATTAVAAGVGKYVLNLGTIPLALISGAGDVITDLVIPHKFALLSLDARVVTPVTTGSKAATLSLEIGAAAVTGGAVALTSANCTPLGAAVAGSAITAANTGAAAGTISLVSSAVTAFAEGSVSVFLTIQNMDTADAFATLLAI